MTDKAKFRYSAQEGSVELEGTEEFVTSHFETLKNIIQMISDSAAHVELQSKKETTLEVNNPKNITSFSKNAESIADYPNIYSEINGKLKVTEIIKGSTASEKMKKLALLYCYGVNLMGTELISSKDIRDVCEDHGVLDTANFSKIFSQNKQLFLSDGVKGGTKQIKLTMLGKKAAEELLKDE